MKDNYFKETFYNCKSHYLLSDNQDILKIQKCKCKSKEREDNHKKTTENKEIYNFQMVI